MKVLLVSPVPPPSGGMARWTQLYVAGIENHDLSVRVVNTNISKKRSVSKNRRLSLFDEFSRSCRITSEFKKVIKEFSPDIVHFCSPCSNLGMLRDMACIMSSKKIPVVFHCHCNIADHTTNALGRYLFRKIVKSSKRVFVLNRASLDFVETIEKDKAVLIPNFIEDDKISSQHFIRERIENAVFVGHVKKKKGICELYQVAREMPDIVFNIYGQIMELPDEPTPANIVLHGEVAHEAISEVLSDADVFVFPSHTEGFANVMLESMAAGLPVIATDVGANRDMIEDKGGIIVDLHNSRQIAEALIKMDSPTERSSMSEWNIKKAKMVYTSSKVIELLENQYLEIVK